MRLAVLQQILVQIATDAEARQAFLDQPEKMGAQWNATETEVGYLKKILHNQLLLFSRLLVEKRSREAARQLPLTEQVLGSDFTKLFHEYAANKPLANENKYPRDAIGFAAFLQRRESVRILTRELAVFEARGLQLREAKWGIGLHCFSYPVHLLSRQIAATEIVRRPRYVAITLWLKVPFVHGIKRWSAQLPRLF